ncbi:MAG: hypothetical protein J6W06_09375 [Bacteroidales bacterium]|nr:hypothetical protein [Bacteroidales bacterium]
MNKNVRFVALGIVCLFILPLGMIAQNLNKEEICKRIKTDDFYTDIIKECVAYQIVAQKILASDYDKILEIISKSDFGIENKNRIEYVKQKRNKQILAGLILDSGLWKEKFVFVPEKCYYSDEAYCLVDKSNRKIRIPEYAVNKQETDGRSAKKVFEDLMNTDFGPFFNDFVKDRETQLSLVNKSFRMEYSSSDEEADVEVTEKNEKEISDSWIFKSAEYFKVGLDITEAGSRFAEWEFEENDKNVVRYITAYSVEGGAPDWYVFFSTYIFKKINGKWMLCELAEGWI